MDLYWRIKLYCHLSSFLKQVGICSLQKVFSPSTVGPWRRSRASVGDDMQISMPVNKTVYLKLLRNYYFHHTFLILYKEVVLVFCRSPVSAIKIFQPTHPYLLVGRSRDRIPVASVTGIFLVDTDRTMCPGVNSASKKLVPGIPLRVKAAGAWGWRPL